MNVWGRNTTHNTHIHIHTHTYESLSLSSNYCGPHERVASQSVPSGIEKERGIDLECLGAKGWPAGPRRPSLRSPNLLMLRVTMETGDFWMCNGLNGMRRSGMGKEILKKWWKIRCGRKKEVWEKIASRFPPFFLLHVLEELAVEVRAGNNFSAKFLRNFFSVNIKYKCSDHEYQSFSFSFFFNRKL